VILHELQIGAKELEERTGWAIKPEGACKGDRCVPLPGMDLETIDVRGFADRLRMPLVADDPNGLWALGPEFDAAPFESAHAPDFTLRDHKGNDFTLSSLRGTKVMLLAWASW
jgi:hypothetical protein